MGMLSLLVGLLWGLNEMRQENTWSGESHTLWGRRKGRKQRDLRPGLYPLGVFRDQIHKKGIRALLALVWEKTGGLSDFSESFNKGNWRGCWSWSVELDSSVTAKRPRKDGKGGERVTQPEGRKGSYLGTWVGTEATRAASELEALAAPLFIQLRGKAYQDSAETRPWTSGALVWKWQLGGGSCDSGADSSPS